ncbi:MAG: glycosyltransferase family 2 protein, partial [Prevotella sp.]|nr:glycosyltransferase family 2 protein [Prevotella sp.]
MRLSIVIPVFCVEDTISRCVESVVNQDYDNIEVILVDDGSPDKCPAICDSWALRDSRVRVIHKQNGGLSDARNAGLAIASGDYITFVDSDDYLD